MRTQTLLLMRKKAGDSGKKHGALTTFIIRMLNGFQISNLNSKTLNVKKI